MRVMIDNKYDIVIMNLFRLLKENNLINTNLGANNSAIISSIILFSGKKYVLLP